MTHHAKAPSSGSSTRQGSRLGAIVRGVVATRGASRRAKGSGAPSRRRAPIALASALVLAALVVLGAATAVADTAPTPAIEAPTEVEFTTAHLKGTVNPNGGPSITHWHFEYSKDPVGEGWSQAPDHEMSQAESEESTALAVSEDLASGTLQPNAKYFVRLVASNDGGQNESSEEELETKAVTAPALTVPTSSAVAYTTAKAAGEVTAGNADPAFNSPCHFDYVTDDHFTAEGFENPGQASCDVEPTGAGATPVSADLSGLTPATEYHLRLVATNAGGTSSEPAAATFTTLAVAKPTLTVDPVTTFTDSSAHFVGHVNPNAPEPEGSASPAEAAAFESSWHFECVAPGPSCGSLAGAAVPAGNAAKTVEADATGLQPNIAYYVRLAASNAGGTEEAGTAASPSFTTVTLGPTVKAFAAGPVQSEAVDLNGQINPHNSPTKYWFEWGTENCETGSCQALPASKDADAGSGPLFVYAIRHLTGLAPATTYHFRLVAENAAGTTAGPDQQFTTAAAPPATCSNEAARAEQQSTYLPDCRAHELVSPAQKNGADVAAMTSKTVAAPAGGAVVFASLAGFGDVRGTSVDAQYVARRSGAAGTSGWATHAITPAGRGHTFPALATEGSKSSFEAFTPDLSRAVYGSWRPLTEATNTADIMNLYVVDGLLTGPESVALATDSDHPISLGFPPESENIENFFKISFLMPRFAAASTDFSHVLFESAAGLTADAPPPFYPFARELYEYADGAVRLVGRVPSSGTECDDVNGPSCIAAPSSVAGVPGSIYLYAGGMMSDDGSRIFFQAPFNADIPTTIYMREDGTRTVQLNASEKTVKESPGTALLWAASSDGTRAFFTSDEGLVDDDDGGESDLYMYDADAPAGARLTLLSRSETGDSHSAGVVIGASDDGHYVYFVSNGQLVAGEPAGPTAGLYLWHDGDLAYIGGFAGGNEVDRNGPRTSWSFPKRARAARAAPDGRHLLFMTKGGAGFAGRGGFAGYDHGADCTHDGSLDACRELYVYSADTGRLACASCNPTGATATADAVTDLSEEGKGGAWITSHLSRALADDGSRVFFSTKEALVPGDTNKTSDAYEYDVPSGTVQMLSSGTSPAPSYFMDASANGDDAYFVTRERLVGWDVDDSYDLYDARAGGGLPEPPARTAACEGEACRPASASAPPSTPVGSVQPGLGNPEPPRRCPKGRRATKVHGKTRCLKPKKHKARERAGANRGGHR